MKEAALAAHHLLGQKCLAPEAVPPAMSLACATVSKAYRSNNATRVMLDPHFQTQCDLQHWGTELAQLSWDTDLPSILSCKVLTALVPRCSSE